MTLRDPGNPRTARDLRDARGVRARPIRSRVFSSTVAGEIPDDASIARMRRLSAALNLRDNDALPMKLQRAFMSSMMRR